jgi:hypothetical protein
MKLSLGHATLAWRVIFIPAAVSLFRGPHIPWVPIFLKKFLLRNVTVAQPDTFLQAAANFFPRPQSLHVCFSGSPRRPAAGFLSLCRFVCALTGFTMASSLKVI